ncbi:MAG TPA: hypothetical protein VK789_28255 [Bryobacteraceae bacterium]|jgi:hypothetical protein|nr:hypothetical protein [Bryobacteraceae bacterium]
MKTHIVILQTADNKLIAVGSDKGQPLSEKQAEILARKYKQSTFRLLAAHALPIHGLEASIAPLPRAKE